MNKVIILSPTDYKKYKYFSRNMRVNLYLSVISMFIFFVLVLISFYPNDNILGRYYPVIDFITIKGANTQTMHLTAYHEIGHHVYYTELQPDEVKYWKSLYVNSTKKDFLREYSSKNPQEDFADVYMSLVYSQFRHCDHIFSIGNMSQLLDEKFNFMCKVASRIN